METLLKPGSLRESLKWERGLRAERTVIHLHCRPGGAEEYGTQLKNGQDGDRISTHLLFSPDPVKNQSPRDELIISRADHFV